MSEENKALEALKIELAAVEAKLESVSAEVKIAADKMWGQLEEYGKCTAKDECAVWKEKSATEALLRKQYLELWSQVNHKKKVSEMQELIDKVNKLEEEEEEVEDTYATISQFIDDILVDADLTLAVNLRAFLNNQRHATFPKLYDSSITTSIKKMLLLSAEYFTKLSKHYDVYVVEAPVGTVDGKAVVVRNYELAGTTDVNTVEVQGYKPVALPDPDQQVANTIEALKDHTFEKLYLYTMRTTCIRAHLV